jgi:hypothetical protein
MQIIISLVTKKGTSPPYVDPRSFKNPLKSNEFGCQVHFGTKFAEKIKMNFHKYQRLRAATYRFSLQDKQHLWLVVGGKQ